MIAPLTLSVKQGKGGRKDGTKDVDVGGQPRREGRTLFLWGKQEKESRWVTLWREEMEWRAVKGIGVGVRGRDHLRS